MIMTTCRHCGSEIKKDLWNYGNLIWVHTNGWAHCNKDITLSNLAFPDYIDLEFMKELEAL